MNKCSHVLFATLVFQRYPIPGIPHRFRPAHHKGCDYGGIDLEQCVNMLAS